MGAKVATFEQCYNAEKRRRLLKTLRENGVIRRIGGDKGGYWEVIENGIEQ